jgi:hypothetical protein
MTITKPYTDPIIKKYIDLIKSINPLIKSYYQGDPIRVPASSLPALIISKTETRVGGGNGGTNVEDEHGIQMTMTLITDIRSDINDEKQIVSGINTLYDILEGRDENYKLKSTSLLNILRSNISLDVSKNLRIDLGSITRIDYGMTVGKRTEDAWAVEGTIQFVTNFIQLRN